MAHKRLTPEQIEYMKAMVLQGTAPEDISKYFQIAISSVHNYKKLFKQQGLQFPDVRGTRPKGTVDVRLTSKPAFGEKYIPTQDTSHRQPTVPTPSVTESMRLTVNGVSISVTGVIKNINVGPNSIEIQF